MFRRLHILCLSVIVCLVFAGCMNNQSEQNNTTQTTACEEKGAYVIEPVTVALPKGALEIACPQIAGNSQDVGAINTLIEQEVLSKLSKILEDCNVNSELSIDYSVTYNCEELVCFLFEGTISEVTAAHPTDFAFSLGVSIEDTCLASLEDWCVLDELFFERFREQLQINQQPARFDEEQWQEIADYINSFSDAQLQTAIYKDGGESLAITEDGVIVIFAVPRAVGDYVLIQIPKVETENGIVS